MRAKEFLEEEVVPFRQKDTRSNAQKYADAVERQTGNRSDLGVVPCPYCNDEWCNFDCDEAQADGFKLPDDEELFRFDKNTNETAAVGIVTAQNTTADVGPGTLAQNIRKLFPNMKKKPKKKSD